MDTRWRRSSGSAAIHASIYAAIAWHELFPLPVVALRNARHLERVARESGAGTALVLFAAQNTRSN